MAYTNGTAKLTFDAHMTPKALKAKVYKDDKLLMAFGLQNGRAQEFRPQDKRRPLLEYDAPNPDGADDTVFKTEWDCMVGDLLSTWLGQSTNKSAFLHRQIAAGTFQSDAVVDGRPCHVIRHQITGGNDETAQGHLSHTFYIDKGRFVIVRHDTINNGVNRTYLYQTVEFGKVPEGFAWGLTLEER